MKIINSQIYITKAKPPDSGYFESVLKSKNIDFIRWAVVAVDDKNYVLNVSHKVNE